MGSVLLSVRTLLSMGLGWGVAYLIENVFLTLCKREMLWSGIVEV